MGFYEEIKKLSKYSSNYALTVLEGDFAGEKALISDSRLIWSSKENGFLEKNITDVLSKIDSGVVDISGTDVYVEELGHEKKLVVCGAGHVSSPIIKIGKLTGFKVICVEDRDFFADDARNAGADEVLCDDFGKALDSIPGDSDTFFAIVTRGHTWDIDCLRSIFKKEYAYIGLMGSPRRTGMVKERLRAEGISEELLNTIHTPIGLGIGAETPEEIAVAVMAEIIEVKNRMKRNFGYPKEILGPILAEYQGDGDGRKILATIVRKNGSAPRQTGTKMLIMPDKTCIGTIGGGSAEAEVMNKGAELLMEPGEKTVLHHVDLTKTENTVNGMVCGGNFDVLMETIL